MFFLAFVIGVVGASDYHLSYVIISSSTSRINWNQITLCMTAISTGIGWIEWKKKVNLGKKVMGF